MMSSARLKRLKAAGWKVGTTKDFLGLSDQEAALVEVKLALIEALKKSRQMRRLSQIDLAQRMGSSQSRIAKIEAGDASVSLDLVVRALIAAGTTQQDIHKAFTSRVPLAS
jgi:ribosome-binding protein aMBF1 (putative translation factor)